MNGLEFIARIRHLGWICFQIAANQSYNERINDDQLKSLINGVQYLLNNPNATPEENHENWVKMKLSQGWKYGKVKDLKYKTHPDLVSFNDLPEIEQKKDIMDNLMNRQAKKLWDKILKDCKNCN